MKVQVRIQEWALVAFAGALGGIVFTIIAVPFILVLESLLG